MSGVKRWRIGASGAVVYRGRVLLVRHTYGEKKGRWALPGGMATHEERIDETVVRELREETGLEVEIIDVSGLRTRYDERGGALFVLFRARPLSGEPLAEGGEVDRVGWFLPQDVEAMSETELLPVARNAALRALEGAEGLGEDRAFPERGDAYRGFLVRRKPGSWDGAHLRPRQVDWHQDASKEESMATVIGIAGSARKNGNSATLMRAVLRGAARAGAETKEVLLNDLVFKGCQGCDRCTASGVCVLDDDLTPVLDQLARAEGWVLASPIYYDSISGQMKTFFDRCRTFTIDPQTQALARQLAGRRKAAVIVAYEDQPRSDYAHEAEKLANYLAWMGDFEVEILSEGQLGPRDAARKRPDLLARAENIGRRLFG
jgi:multimeric flavodoxin WrbA/ADP-ribose pyrophosphatase YjhB (NUDIX family)